MKCRIALLHYATPKLDPKKVWSILAMITHKPQKTGFDPNPKSKALEFLIFTRDECLLSGSLEVLNDVKPRISLQASIRSHCKLN